LAQFGSLPVYIIKNGLIRNGYFNLFVLIVILNFTMFMLSICLPVGCFREKITAVKCNKTDMVEHAGIVRTTFYEAHG